MQMEVAMRAHALMAALMLCGPVAVAGPVFRCIDAAGAVTYTDVPDHVDCVSNSAPTPPPPAQTAATSARLKKTSAPPRRRVANTATAEVAPPRTKDGFFACRTRQLWDDLVTFRVAEDRESFAAYMDGVRCFQLKGNLHVTIMSGPGLLGGVVEAAHAGMRFFTAREALVYR
jgi:hypothetical protein